MVLLIFSLQFLILLVCFVFWSCSWSWSSIGYTYYACESLLIALYCFKSQVFIFCHGIRALKILTKSRWFFPLLRCKTLTSQSWKFSISSIVDSFVVSSPLLKASLFDYHRCKTLFWPSSELDGSCRCFIPLWVHHIVGCFVVPPLLWA